MAFRKLFINGRLNTKWNCKEYYLHENLKCPFIISRNILEREEYIFLVEEKLSVELKAQTKIEPAHFAQAINYLEAYNLEIGLLINFGNMKLEFHRLQNKKFKQIVVG
jgi:GxxExxY protein